MRWIEPDFDKIADHVLTERSPEQFAAAIARGRQQIIGRQDREDVRASWTRRDPRKMPLTGPCTLLVPPWGWFTLEVNMDRSYEFKGFTVRRPGVTTSLSLLANLQRRDTDRAVPYGLAGVAGVTGFVALATQLPGAIGGPITLLGAAAGAGGGWRGKRYLDKLVDNTRQLPLPCPDEQSGYAFTAVVRLAQVRWALSTFDRDMKKTSKKAGLEPLALPIASRPDWVLGRLHHAVWDLIADESDDDPAVIVEHIEQSAVDVDAAIEQAWQSRRSFTVREPPAAPAAKRTRRRTVEDLQRLHQDVADSTEAADRARQDLRRINGYTDDDPTGR